MENFWDNKPVNVITTSPIKKNKQILPIEDAFININREIIQMVIFIICFLIVPTILLIQLN